MDSSKTTRGAGNAIYYEGDVDLRGKGLTSIPIKFGDVSGTFDCSGIGLTSLNNSPVSVGKFVCSNNNLTSLVGGPTQVRTSFNCSGNKLKNLVGGPVRGDVRGLNNDIALYDCSNNNLESLLGYPSTNTVIGTFNCSNNLPLKTLEYVTPKVTTLNCSNCDITDAALDFVAFTCSTFNGRNQKSGVLDADSWKEATKGTNIQV